MAIVYKGRVFSLEVETTQFPNGTTHTVEVVRHVPCVVLVPLQDDGRVVLIRQYRHSVRRDLWELPAGSIDPGESPDAAAARECEEEIGLAPHRLERLTSLYPAPGYCDEEMIFYRATELRPPAPDSLHEPDEDEDIQVNPVTLAEARAMVARGEIVDLKTAYALTLV
jgi:8-oxo-dGTP pyrophosphatase MutT (NUDIX family)